jgi:DNA-binding response OmpR family regulator
MLNKRHKVLVVDDEHAIGFTLATILGYQGYETATAYIQRRRSDSSGLFISAQLHS